MLAVYFIAFVWTRSHASWQDFSSAVLSITKDYFLKKDFIITYICSQKYSLWGGWNIPLSFVENFVLVSSRNGEERCVTRQNGCEGDEDKPYTVQPNTSPKTLHSQRPYHPGDAPLIDSQYSPLPQPSFFGKLYIIHFCTGSTEVTV